MSSKNNFNLDQYQVQKTNKVLKVLIYIGLVIWALIDLFPVYWMFTFSLKSNEEVYGTNVMGLPKDWLWSNYSTAMTTGNMPLYFLNSVIVTVSSIAICLVAAMMATYALTRIIWKGSKTMNAFFMLGITIPIHSSIVPIFITLSKLKMVNSYWAMIIPYSAFSLAMAILICTGFMNDIPKDLDEAAYIDGCTLWQTFIKIIVPLMKPALATISIYTFLQCWNELMFAQSFISQKKYRTLPVGIQALSGQHTTDWGPIGAALVIATFPTLLVYVFMSKSIQESFIAGAVKG
ncbi:MAG: carbohydrate ABC transporter permease [Lachnospiraceae bacterium]|nr:carbohydrate ABC transporter permease [Lachnospiraceae bacterium]MBR3508757.1 carbohydrate ABC transporter permease [Lachnospiraceae bacterium]MBR4604619.1 carbohydrate ABC transporter permease [Lachnospiraceae bacterium]MBR6152010.1 carbohydrate ABC transporter permease [Lachnospiraceae bacterium]